MITPHLLGLRALVSGIPEPQRSRRLLFMLQALLDESETFEEPRVFVLAGYLASVERWEKLTDAWQQILNYSPRIDYFSFREAYPLNGKPRGQFSGMNLKQRDERVAMFRSTIEQELQAEIGIGVKMEPYEVGLDKMAENAYLFAMSSVALAVARNMEDIGFERQRVEFIFDDRKINKPYIIDAWFWALDRSNPDPPDLFEQVLVDTPQFRNNRNDVIALQAADMYAGWTRACNFAEMRGQQPFVLPGTTKRLPGLFITYTDEMLQYRVDRIRRRNAATYLLEGNT